MSELDPQRHIRKSRNVASGYALSNIIKSEPFVDALLGLLEEQFDKLIASGQPVEFDRWFNYFAFDVVGEVTFSSPFRFLETGTDIRNAIANTRALALYIAIMGHYVWLHNLTLGNPLLSRIGLQPSSHIFDTCLAAIDSRKKNPDVRLDMMERWLHVRREYPDRMDEAEVFGAAVANIGAGADTTSATLQAFFYYLLRHPQYLQKLRQEVDEAHTRGDLSHVVSYAEAAKLPYLQACVCGPSSIAVAILMSVDQGNLSLPPGYRHWATSCCSGGWSHHWWTSFHRRSRSSSSSIDGKVC